MERKRNSMNTHTLIRLAAAKGGLTQQEMRRALDALVESITGELLLGNDVHIA
ncbi:bacterial DNA-binding family protein, partial [Bacteroides fragilis str. S23 R14]